MMVTAPANLCIDATALKSDTVDLPNGACRSLFIGGGGTLVVFAPGSTTAVSFLNVQSELIFQLRTKNGYQRFPKSVREIQQG
jgi:hypothetical protein